MIAFPFEGEGGAPATDEGGRTALTFCYAAFKRTLKCIGTAEKSLPPGGEGVAPATDEGGRTVLTFAPNKLRTTPLSPTVSS